MNMDYINTDLSLDDVMKALEGLSDTPQKAQMLHDLHMGHETMTTFCNLVAEKCKASVFRFYRRKMISRDETCTDAYRLGLMCALAETGLRFILRNEKQLKEKMELTEQKEKKYDAMKKAMQERP